ncbi:hypothetical protein J3169_004404 [Salmonella enterica]|nr:hypothetical protein [Salmonella enterica]
MTYRKAPDANAADKRRIHALMNNGNRYALCAGGDSTGDSITGAVVIMASRSRMLLTRYIGFKGATRIVDLDAALTALLIPEAAK